MTEILFILTVLFIAYIVHNLQDEQKKSPLRTVSPENLATTDDNKALNFSTKSTASKPHKVELIAMTEQASTIISKVSNTPPAKSEIKIKSVSFQQTKSVENKTAIQASPNSENKIEAINKPIVNPSVNSPIINELQNKIYREVRNPLNKEEIAPIYSNYRFMKRWVKEALVTEGLLNKVYKPNDLTIALEEQIKEALQKLAAMDKYRV